MLAGTMSPSQIDAVNGQLKRHLEAAVVPEVLEFPDDIPEPDSQFMDEYLISLQRFSDFVDEMEEPLSERDRKFLKDSSIMLFVVVNRIDQLIESVRSLPDSVLWKQRGLIYDSTHGQLFRVWQVYGHNRMDLPSTLLLTITSVA